jgi:hypothetical protein
MLIHSVFFTLRDDLTEQQRIDFRTGVESLATIPSAASVHIGTPADTPVRPVINRDYDIALTVILNDIPAHDAYQEDPIHNKFIQDYNTYWTNVTIYDAD